MGTFVITSSALNNQYTYTNASVFVSGSYSLDAQTNVEQNISGQVYTVAQGGGQGDYIGNFNGYLNGDEMQYTLSQMTRQKANMVWDAIDEIDAEIHGQNAE